MDARQEGTSMKIAYIILCHKSPNQINGLISSLNRNDSDFYIHIDKKSDIKKQINKADNIKVLDDSKRVDIKWGQSSMVEATFNAIETIIGSKNKYDYVWLISGQDFPIKSRGYIIEYLERNKGANFIEVIKNPNTHKRYLKRTSLYYPKWIVNNKTWIKVLKRIYIEITGGYNRNFIKRKNSTGMEFYFGSQWWAFTYDFIKYVFDFYKENPEKIRYFENTIIPDESLFQTIIMNSQYKDTVMDYLTYVNWESNKRNPKTLSINDIDELRSSKYLLARKFDEEVDKDILNYVQSNLG